MCHQMCLLFPMRTEVGGFIFLTANNAAVIDSFFMCACVHVHIDVHVHTRLCMRVCTVNTGLPPRLETSVVKPIKEGT